MPAGNACSLARAKLSQAVSNLRTASGPEKFGTAVKAGYLANLKTPSRNILGNTTQQLADLTTRNIAAGADYLQALVRSASTGGRMKPHEFRQIAATLNLPGFRAGGQGIKEGVHKAVQIMRTGVNVDMVDQKFGRSVTFRNPVLNRATQAVFDFMEASDKPFYGFAFQTSLYSRARLQGIRAGMKGKRLAEYIDQTLANPTEDMVLGAHTDAAMSTYKNETVLSNMASDIKRGLKARQASSEGGRKVGYGAGMIAVDLTMPFTRVPSAILNVAADYSPAGFVKAVAYSMDPNPKIQAELVQRLTKASIGTGLMLWGMKAAEQGNATGSFPKDAGQRERWALEGKKANSVKIGDTWRDIRWLGPMAIPFLMGVNITAAEEAEGFKEKAAIGVGFLGKTLTEMAFLTGISALVEGLEDPVGKGASAISRIAVPLPAMVGHAAAAVDPVQRQATTVGEKVQARLPFASKGLPPRLSAFGDTLKRPGGVGAFLDVSFGSKATDTEITRELDRLGVNPGRIGRQLTLAGEKVRRSPTEVNELTTEFGPIKQAVLAEVMGSPDYAGLTDEEKKRALEDALRDVGRTAGDVDRARRSGDPVPRQSSSDFLSNAGSR